MKNLLLLTFSLLFNLGCAYEISQSQISPEKNTRNNLIQVFSTDRILTNLVCSSIEKSGNGKCVLKIGSRNPEETEQIKQIFIETQIRKSSSNYFTNAGKSLLTLTLGIFLTNSAEVDFLFHVKDNEGILLENTSLTSTGETGYWGVLPIYTGFIATNVGTALNSYRRPDHLQKYCIYDDPSKIRETLEAKKEDFCTEYEIFLQDSFYKIEKDFLQIIQETN